MFQVLLVLPGLRLVVPVLEKVLMEPLLPLPPLLGVLWVFQALLVLPGLRVVVAVLEKVLLDPLLVPLLWLLQDLLVRGWPDAKHPQIFHCLLYTSPSPRDA